MSSFDLIARYLGERGRLGVFVPLAFLLAATGRVFREEDLGSLSDFVAAAALAFVLTLAFRVWDDLEDRARDAREHPHRVMVAASATSPFIALAAVLAGAGVLPLVVAPNSQLRLGALGLAVIVLLVRYRLRARKTSGLVVMLKYPAIAIAVAPQGAPPSAVALALLYVAVCAYEAFDDPTLRTSISSLFEKRHP